MLSDATTDCPDERYRSEQERMTQVWVGESRRSTRVPLNVVFSAQGISESLTSDGVTIVVNLHGALINCSFPMQVGLKIEIHVISTGQEHSR